MLAVITAESLAAIRLLVRLVLQREQQAVGPGDPVSAERMDQLLSIPPATLLATIERHRLATLLNGDPLLGVLVPELQAPLRALARAETMAALALTSLTGAIAALFQRADLPMLVIKGIPLAVQTTGESVARGRGDLDLFIHPKQLPQAVALLESEGFVRRPGNFPRTLDRFWGRYSRWAGYELSLLRRGPAGLQWIDLHWSLSNVRAPLPSFEQAWRCREAITLGGHSVATLGRLHAFQHGCAHAAKDQWMCLRNLVDLDRLARQLNPNDCRQLSRLRVVAWSAAVTYATTVGVQLRPLFEPASLGCRRALWRAQRSQALAWRCQGPGPWTPQRWLETVWRMLILSGNPIDWLRTVLYFTFRPSAFTNSRTGKDHGLAGLIVARWDRLNERLRETSRELDHE